MYRPKVMGKPLALDVSLLLKRIHDAIQVVFKTYPQGAAGSIGTTARTGGASAGDAARSKREGKLRAESSRAASTATLFRNSIR